MKKVSGIVIVVILALGFHQNAFAQRGEYQGPDYEKLTEELDLTEEQVADLKKLDEAFRDKMKEMRAGAREDRQDRREQFVEMQKEREESMSEILSEEQMEQWKAMRKERFEERKRKGPRRDRD